MIFCTNSQTCPEALGYFTDNPKYDLKQISIASIGLSKSYLIVVKITHALQLLKGPVIYTRG